MRRLSPNIFSAIPERWAEQSESRFMDSSQVILARSDSGERINCEMITTFAPRQDWNGGALRGLGEKCWRIPAIDPRCSRFTSISTRHRMSRTRTGLGGLMLTVADPSTCRLQLHMKKILRLVRLAIRELRRQPGTWVL
jgi:hypothetical protein